ncbi:MAG TPA: nickel pincer cofactor biosynthesis protein LarC [Actinomycetota bacterium]|nr:nickel pincer cofactor biosynthesis protein LarC [Actinomycetota bacterium]
MIAYLDCFSGAAGDMILAALIDAGADASSVRKSVDLLGLGASIEFEDVSRAGIRGVHTRVTGDDSLAPRTFAEARALIDHAELGDSVRARSLSILTALARAEAKVHGVTIEQVHFHEIGALDTLIDIIGVSSAMSELGLEGFMVGPIATSIGSIESQHGILPLPAPAVTALLEGFELVGRAGTQELVTPTGAAIIAATGTPARTFPSMKIVTTGYGAGARDLETPNLLRVIIGEARSVHADEDAVQIEANIDDMNPEYFGYVFERLFAAGALDVWTSPIVGKKGRPANIIGILGPVSAEMALRDVVLTETSSIGIRVTPVRRWILDREWVQVTVEGMAVRVKVARDGGRVVNISPEYSDCEAVARETGIPLKEVFRLALGSLRL